MNKKSLVIIMSEDWILKYLVSQFKRTFDTKGFNTANKGLAYIRKNPVKVVILDTIILVPAGEALFKLATEREKTALPFLVIWGPLNREKELFKELMSKYHIFTSEEMDPDVFLRSVCRAVGK